MPLNRLRDLCERISEETDHEELARLIAELTALLQEEQDGIRAKIKLNVIGKDY